MNFLCNISFTAKYNMPPKKSKKPKRRVLHAEDEKELEFAVDGEGYAKITKKLGNNRIMAFSPELNKEIPCHIRGNIRGKSRKDMYKDNWVLISFRDLNGEYTRWKKTGDPSEKITGDVIYAYSEKDVRDLEKAGEIKDELTNLDEQVESFIKTKKTKINLNVSPKKETDPHSENSSSESEDWLDYQAREPSSKKPHDIEDVIDFI